MDRSFARVLGLALAALLGSASVSRGQAPESAIFDPPETEYVNGALAADPAIERSLPVVSPHRAFLPIAVDLTARMPSVGDQGKSSSCAAWAAAYAARSYYTSALERRDISRPANLPSPSYVYHLAREKGCDDGTNIPRVVQVLKNGALSLAEYPYRQDCISPASSQLVARAHDFRVAGLRRVDLTRTDEIRGQLAQSNPVIIRLQDSRGFHRHRGAGTFAELPSDPRIDFTGWHFVTAVGYDERRQALRIINSWGPGWGDRGYAWLSYDVLRTRVSHAYVLDVLPPRRPTEASVQPPRPPAPPSPTVPPRVQPRPTPPPPTPPPPLRPQTGDLAVTTAQVEAACEPGGQCNFETVLMNAGPAVWVGTARLTATLPPRTMPLAVSEPWACTPDGQRVTCEHPPVTLNLGESLSLTLRVQLPAEISQDSVNCINGTCIKIRLVQPAPVTPRPHVQLSDLSSLSCGRVVVQSRGGWNVLSGYVASEEDLNLVKSIAEQVPNTRVADVMVAPWPQCEALQTLENALAVEDRPSIDLPSGRELQDGDPLMIRIRPPSQISFLYVAYVQADGSLVNLVQPRGLVPQPTLPGQTLIFGDGQEGRQKFTVSAPFGREMIIAIASRSPLFEETLPETQTEREYLSALRRALLYKPSPDMPDREVAATIFTLHTRAR